MTNTEHKAALARLKLSGGVAIVAPDPDRRRAAEGAQGDADRLACAPDDFGETMSGSSVATGFVLLSAFVKDDLSARFSALARGAGLRI
jgi:hypothetical protein